MSERIIPPPLSLAGMHMNVRCYPCRIPSNTCRRWRSACRTVRSAPLQATSTLPLRAVADLILAQSSVRETIERWSTTTSRRGRPVGDDLPASNREEDAHRSTLRPSARIVSEVRPEVAPEAYSGHDFEADFIVRGEGEITFRELLRALERARGSSTSRIVVPAPSWRHAPFARSTRRQGR